MRLSVRATYIWKPSMFIIYMCEAKGLLQIGVLLTNHIIIVAYRAWIIS